MKRKRDDCRILSTDVWFVVCSFLSWHEQRKMASVSRIFQKKYERLAPRKIDDLLKFWSICIQKDYYSTLKLKYPPLTPITHGDQMIFLETCLLTSPHAWSNTIKMKFNTTKSGNIHVYFALQRGCRPFINFTVCNDAVCQHLPRLASFGTEDPIYWLDNIVYKIYIHCHLISIGFLSDSIQ